MSDLMKLKDYEEQPFAKLMLLESARQKESPSPELAGLGEYGVFDHDIPTVTKNFYQLSAVIHTGIIGRTDQADFSILPTTERYFWADLVNGLGPERVVPKFTTRFEMLQDRLSKYDVVKEGKDGSLLIWNGTLPGLYTENLEEAYQKNPKGLPMPSSIPHLRKSCAIIVGVQAIQTLFGIETLFGLKIDIKDTRDIYRALAAKEYTENYKRAAKECSSRPISGQNLAGSCMLASGNISQVWAGYWNAVETEAKSDEDKAELERLEKSWRIVLNPNDKKMLEALEEKIDKVPLDFFKEGIFSKYDVPKPEGYAVPRTV